MSPFVFLVLRGTTFIYTSIGLFCMRLLIEPAVEAASLGCSAYCTTMLHFKPEIAELLLQDCTFEVSTLSSKELN